MNSDAGLPATGDRSVAPPRRWLVIAVGVVFYLVMAYAVLQHVRVHWSSMFVLGAGGLLVTGVVLGLDGLADRFVLTGWRKRLALIGAAAVIVTLQLLLVREIYATVGWDPRSVFSAAIALSDFRQSAVAPYTPEVYLRPGLSIPYWSSYPNNLLIAFTYEIVFRLCAGFDIPSPVFLSTALNVLVLDLAILLAALTAGRLWGRRARRMTLFVAVPFLGFSPWISIAYTDTIATVFPVLLVYLYVRYLHAAPQRQFAYVAAMGAATAVGYLYKPHVIAMTLAIGMVHALSPGLESGWTARLARLATFLLVAVAIMWGFGAYRDHRLSDRIPKAQLEASRFPVTHFIAMSLNSGLGGYNAQDVEEQRALVGSRAKNERNLRVIRERLAEMGPAGYAAFLHRKLTWITTDGTFYWQQEGRLADYEPIHDGRVARRVQSVFYRDGAHYRWFESAANAVWLAILVWMVAPLGTERRFDDDRMLVVIRLAVVILLAMLLVIEGRSRYLISFIPVFAMLSGYCLRGIRWSTAAHRA